jgi:hypothetical protein
MDMTKIFPSPWFAASDFDAIGKEMTIGNVMMQQVSAEFKPVVYFHGQEKALVLNPTNNKLMIAMFGGDSKNWTGKNVVLYSFSAVFQGQPQSRLGVRAPDGRATPAEPVSPPSSRPLPRTDDMNDEVPF